MRRIHYISILLALVFSCKQKDLPHGPLDFVKVEIDNKPPAVIYYDVRITPVIKLSFNNSVDRQTVAANVTLFENGVALVPTNHSYEKNDSVVVLTPQSPLKNITRYFIRIFDGLKSVHNTPLGQNVDIQFITSIDSSDKFPLLTDSQLLDTVQRRTF